MTFRNQEYREIITKAVCGRGNRNVNAKHSINPDNTPSSILGCWIINHQYDAVAADDDVVQITGTYDINIWYSCHDNTQTEVVIERVSYEDEIPLSQKDEYRVDEEYDVLAKVEHHPNCLECTVSPENGEIEVTIEREFTVQVIGETKLTVKVHADDNQETNAHVWDFTVSGDSLRHASERPGEE